MNTRNLPYLLVPVGLGMAGAAIGAAAAPKHPSIGAAVGSAILFGLPAAWAFAFAGGFEEEKPKVGTSRASLHLGSVGGFP